MNIAWIKYGLIGMLAVLLFGAGWTVKGWKVGNDQKDAMQAQADAAVKQYLALNQSNQQTAQGLAVLLTSLEGQAHAFAQIDAYLAAHPMGACSFDPATDGLWNGAYDAAFGSHQAAGGHDPAGRPAAASGQHEPAHR